MRIRRVRDAAADASAAVSKESPYSMTWCSAIQISSKPDSPVPTICSISPRMMSSWRYLGVAWKR
jgi:hypothetical protein